MAIITDARPKFNGLNAEHFRVAIQAALQNYKVAITNSKQQLNPNWENAIQPLEEAAEQLERIWSLLQHLNAVANSAEIRTSYDELLPVITNFHTDIMQDVGLYKIFDTIKSSTEYKNLNHAQQIIIDNELRDFKLSGVHLESSLRSNFKTMIERLSELENQFANNVLDATEGWTYYIAPTEQTKLKGIPDLAVQAAAAKAAAQQKTGWMFGLDYPSYHAVLTYAEDRGLRKELYIAYNCRASDQGPTAGQWDNTAIIAEIIAIRSKVAKLLGYNSFIEYSLASKMADSPEQLDKFIANISEKTKAKAKEEYLELSNFIKQTDKLDTIQPWDLSFYSEIYKQKTFNISDESLRLYFPEPRVLNGLFKLVKKLYGIAINEIFDFEKWHDSVRLFEVIDQENAVRGYFYIDLYAREGKRGGAWMSECLSRIRFSNNLLQLPIAYLNCNFAAPILGQPGLLTHNDVLTLFHEFGHTLHHVLTKVDYFSASGISGVAWDAVEFPSQFMENWCWEWQVIQDISEHIETGKSLPKAEFDNLLATKNYHSALSLLRQLEFTSFDLRIHANLTEDQNASAQQILDKVRAEFSILPVYPQNRFQNSFSHVFAGGYDAGYYSYLWAEVLACDAFQQFRDQGLFNAELGRAFLSNILEQGGSKPAMDLFVAFAGREPEIDALLKHHAIM